MVVAKIALELTGAEHFQYIEYDAHGHGITWLGSPMTEAELRVDLKRSGVTDTEIDATINRARAHAV